MTDIQYYLVSLRVDARGTDVEKVKGKKVNKGMIITLFPYE
jgi:hypothetical protein